MNLGLLVVAMLALVSAAYCAREMVSVMTAADEGKSSSETDDDGFGEMKTHRRGDKRERKRRRMREAASAIDKTVIVNEHNKYRAAEGASNMNKMYYNNYLAKMADEWALGCKFSHGHPPRTDAPWSWIGQNLYAVSVPKINYTRAILAWYLEKNYYNYALKKCDVGRVCGHYTQVVWWESINIGCAAAICPVLADSTFTNAGFIVCNYGPGGNYVGEFPYSKGPACSACPANATTCSDKLCA